MLSHFLRQTINFFGILFRTVRALCTRRLMGVWARLRRFFDFSRRAARAAPEAFQEAASALKKPTRREDYIETSRLYISKSFLITLLAGLAAVCLLAYFVAWPFIVSRFLTARMYWEDAKLADWSGRVIVYYDQERKRPMYSGTLADGVLQGRGKEYGLDGTVTYDGGFLDGLYDGKGAQYQGGVLVYRGEFRGGVYEGSGELYEDGVMVYSGGFSAGEKNGLGAAWREGVMVYSGMFAAGLYSGEGTSYYPSGAVEYTGAFSQGLWEGTGTVYHENGIRAYAGAFAAGLREGEGSAYREDGSVLYKGGFAQDLYEGGGTLYLENGDTVQAEFLAGVTNGSIRWYRSGRLWYDGEADNVTPHGFGTVYGRDGKILYAGRMDGGTVDGAWLLTLTSEEFRAACGDAALAELDRGTGFVIQNEALGLSVLCSFRREDQASAVYRAWLQPTDSVLLPWAGQEEARAWAAEGRELVEGEKSSQGRAERPDGTMGGDWRQFSYVCGAYRCTLLCEGEETGPVQILWSREWDAGGSGAEGGGESALAQAQERLEELTRALEEVGGGSGGVVSRGGVERLLGLMLTAEDAGDLTDALADFLVNQKAAEALEANQPLLAQRLADEQTALERGGGTQAAVDAARDQADRLDLQLAQYQSEREKARAEVRRLTTLDPEDYELQPVLVLFDPAELDAAALYDGALEYAKGVAAGRYVVDTAALEAQVRASLLGLSGLYESCLTASRRLERLEQTLQEKTQGYARGTVSKAELYEAQCAVSEAVAAAYQTMGSFTKTANRLNCLSGGWVAREYGWLPDAFESVFRGERTRGGQAAAELEEERRQREEEAAKALEERRQESGRDQAAEQ